MFFIFSEILQFAYQTFRRHSIIVGLLGMSFLAYLAGVANPSTTSDYQIYELVYNDPVNRGIYFERGYDLVSQFFYNLGWSYASFRILFCYVAMLILFIGVLRFTNNIALFSAVYGITIFSIDATQIRNLMMIAIVTLGLSFLKTINIRNVSLSLVLILLAAEFQSLGYVFLLTIFLILVFSSSLKKNPRIHIICFCVLSLIVILFLAFFGISKVSNLLVEIAGVLGSRGNLVEKISGQYVYGSSVRNWLLTVISTFFGLFYSYGLYSSSVSSGDEVKTGKNNVIFWTAITSLLCLPLLFFAVDYSRIQRACFIFIIIEVSIYSERYFLNVNKNKMVLYLVPALVCTLYGVTHNLIWGPNFIHAIPYITQIFS